MCVQYGRMISNSILPSLESSFEADNIFGNEKLYFLYEVRYTASVGEDILQGRSKYYR